MSHEVSTGHGLDEGATYEKEKRTLQGQHRLLLRGIANRLEGEFGELLPRDTLEHYVADSYEELSSRAKVLTHIPAFVERFARQRLKALARNEGLVDDHPPEVLFVCRRNDATSQMAAAIFNRDVVDRAHASSAGPIPAHDLEEKAVHALQEIDIELLDAFPKPITEEVERAADVVITLDSHDDIPIVDGRHYEAWRLPDLHEQGLEGYRQLRQELESRIVELVDRIVPAAPPPTHVAFDADLDELKRLVAEMSQDVVALIRRLGVAVNEPDGGDLDAIVAADAPIDQADLLISQRVMELIARRQPVASDLRTILAAGSATLHLERIADEIVDVAKVAGRGQLARSGDVARHLSRMADTVASMTEMAVDALIEHNATATDHIVEQAGTLEGLHRRVFADLADVHANGTDRAAAIRTDRASRSIKRAGEHALDIYEQAVFVTSGQRVELGRAG